MCDTQDVVVRPDNYYQMNEEGEPYGDMVQHGGEHLYYCNNCGDVSYSYKETKQHIERSQNDGRA